MDGHPLKVSAHETVTLLLCRITPMEKQHMHPKRASRIWFICVPRGGMLCHRLLRSESGDLGSLLIGSSHALLSVVCIHQCSLSHFAPSNQKQAVFVFRPVFTACPSVPFSSWGTSLPLICSFFFSKPNRVLHFHFCAGVPVRPCEGVTSLINQPKSAKTPFPQGLPGCPDPRPPSWSWSSPSWQSPWWDWGRQWAWMWSTCDWPWHFPLWVADSLLVL